MDFKEIDSMIDDAMKRLKTGQGSPSPYNEPPAAADHFLLKRSWEYFRIRSLAMEKEWKDILGAKDNELKALREIIRLREERLDQLESKTRDSDKIQEEFARLRLAEERHFSESSQKLHDSWEEEKDALMRSVHEADGRVQRIRAEAEQRLKSTNEEVNFLRASLEKARAEIATQSAKRVESDGEGAKALAERDELIRSLESKVDLLRTEVERRDSIMKELSERLEMNRKEAEQWASQRRLSEDEFTAAKERVRFLEDQLEAARREMESLRASWKREQAEWRELWDRSRTMWEKKKSDE